MTRMNAYTDNICRYFDQTSPANTRRALEIACQRAVRPDIYRMVIPTCSDKSALLVEKLSLSPRRPALKNPTRRLSGC